jgi:hypothetical protein
MKRCGRQKDTAREAERNAAGLYHRANTSALPMKLNGKSRSTFQAFFRATQKGRRNRVLENQLLVLTVLKKDGVFIERAHFSREPGSGDQKNRDVLPALQSRGEKRFLNIDDC